MRAIKSGSLRPDPDKTGQSSFDFSRVVPQCSQDRGKFRISTLEKLAEFIHPDQRKELERLERVTDRFPFATTPYYLSLIDWSNPGDPVARQCIPSELELDYSLPGSSEDPLAEHEHMPVPGLVHRYRDRVLIMATGFCYSLCRHCNRKRNWNRGVEVPAGSRLESMRNYVKSRPFIREVILSGGDPLTLSPDRLDRLLHAFSTIDTVEVLRVGTRVPVVLPQALTAELASLLATYRPLWVNTHFNHPAEITDSAAAACDRMLTSGLPVSNHTVLLSGVNNSFETLKALFTRLNAIMVRPYYLFHCDAVNGTDHFRTSIPQGIALMEKLWGDVGGLCLPRYVVDLPDGGGKARVVPSSLVGLNGDVALFRTSEGRVIRYGGALGASVGPGA